MADIEADGPVPGLYSMISVGLVRISPDLTDTFYAELKPIGKYYKEDALKSCNFTREQTLQFNDPLQEMQRMKDWIQSTNKTHRPIFISDNNGFDFAFVNYYFHLYFQENPFGWTSQNLGGVYKGITRNMRKNFKHLRDTKHTHNALDDAMGNAEAFNKMIQRGLRT